jgi:hypothetical protein
MNHLSIKNFTENIHAKKFNLRIENISRILFKTMRHGKISKTGQSLITEGKI